MAGRWFNGLAALLVWPVACLALSPREVGPQPAPIVLLSGFGPFGGLRSNASWEIVKTYDGRTTSGGYRLVALQLPVAYDRAARLLRGAVQRLRPAIVLCFGVGPSDGVRLEAVAENLDDCESADNAGRVRRKCTILPGAPRFYASSLPLNMLQARLASSSVTVAISRSAGNYLCNHVFFHLMDELHQTEVPGGFVHISSGQAKPPTRAAALLAENARVVRKIVDALVAWHPRPGNTISGTRPGPGDSNRAHQRR